MEKTIVYACVNMAYKKRQEQGFTLTYLLIFIAVISVVGIAYSLVASNREDEDMKRSVNQTDRAISQNETITTDAPEPEKVIGPGITYLPEGSIPQQEIESLNKYLVEPYYAYNEQFLGKEGYTEIKSFAITRKSDAIYDDLPSNFRYRYSVDIIEKYKNETYQNTLSFGKDDVLEWWVPECFDEGICYIGDSFRNQYPEIVEILEENNTNIIN